MTIRAPVLMLCAYSVVTVTVVPLAVRDDINKFGFKLLPVEN